MARFMAPDHPVISSAITRSCALLLLVCGLALLFAPGAPGMLGLAAAPVLLLALGYGVLLFRGPLDRPRDP